MKIIEPTGEIEVKEVEPIRKHLGCYSCYAMRKEFTGCIHEKAIALKSVGFRLRCKGCGRFTHWFDSLDNAVKAWDEVAREHKLNEYP